MRNGFLDDIGSMWDDEPPRKRVRAEAPDPEDVTVYYVRVRCPKCKSFRVPVYDSNHLPIRYHKCSDCGFRFKSVEKV